MRVDCVFGIAKLAYVLMIIALVQLLFKFLDILIFRSSLKAMLAIHLTRISKTYKYKILSNLFYAPRNHNGSKAVSLPLDK